MNFEEFIKNKNNGIVTQSTPRAMERFFINQSAQNAQDIGNKATHFIQTVQSRYFDKDGNYIDIYREDDNEWKQRALQYANELSGVIDSVASYYKQNFSNDEGFSDKQKRLYEAKDNVDNLAKWVQSLESYENEVDYNTKKQQSAKAEKYKDVYNKVNIKDLFGKIQELEDYKKKIDEAHANNNLPNGTMYEGLAEPFDFKKFITDNTATHSLQQNDRLGNTTPKEIELSLNDIAFLMEKGHLKEVKQGNRTYYQVDVDLGENIPPVIIQSAPIADKIVKQDNQAIKMSEENQKVALLSGQVYEQNGKYYRYSDNKEVTFVSKGDAVNPNLNPQETKPEFKDYKYINPFEYNRDNINDAILQAKEELHDVSFVQATFNMDEWHSTFAQKEDWNELSAVPEKPDSADADKLTKYNYEEKQIYYYLKNSQGQDAADKWLTVMTSTAEKRYNKKKEAQYNKLVEEYGDIWGLLDAASIGFNVLSAIEYVPQTLNYFDTGFLKTNQAAKIATTFRQYRTDSIDWMIGDWDAHDFLYNVGMSTADSAIASLLPGGVGGTVLGLSAAASATNDALERGMSSEQAFWHGAYAGAFEAIFESVSIGNIKSLATKNIVGKKGAIKEVLKSMLVNASEENLTECANLIYDTMANGDFSQASTLIQKYLDEGKSPEEAKRLASKDLAYQIAEATASGFISGGVMGGVGTVTNFKKGSDLGKQVRAEYTKDGLNSLYEYAKNNYSFNKDISAIVGKYTAENIDNHSLGVLYSSVVTEVASRLDACRTISELNNKCLEILNESNDAIAMRNVLLKLREEAAYKIAKKNKNKAELNEITPEKDVAFYGKKYHGQYSTEQANALKRINNQVLKKAYKYFYTGESFDSAVTYNNEVDGKIVGTLGTVSSSAINRYIPKNAIGMNNKTYDYLKKVGLVNYDGTVNGYALIDEIARRREMQSENANKNVIESSTIPSDSESGAVQQGVSSERATELQSMLPNISAQGPEADPVADAVFEAKGVERLTNDQKFIKKVGKAFGREVKFKNLDEWRTDENGKRYLFSPNGAYNKTTGEIIINSSKNSKGNALAFIFKHELTHFAETAGESFTLFMNEVMDSQAFKDWVKSKGYADSDSVSATMAMNAEYVKRWKFNGKDAEHKANIEMVADFVGENLFAKDLTRLEQAIKQMQPKTVKTFKEWILNILDKLKTALQSIGKHTEIEALERDFVRICDEAMKNAEKKTVQGTKKVDNDDTQAYSYYDEFQTNVLQWAYSASTKIGDTKIFNSNKRGFVLLEATNDGYIEIANGSYAEVKELYEQAYRNATNEIYGNIEGYESDKGRDFWNLQLDGNGRNAVGNNSTNESQGFSTDITGNNEHLRSGNQRTSKQSGTNEADLNESAFSMPENEQYSFSPEEREELLRQYEDGQITKKEYLGQLDGSAKPQTLFDIIKMTEDDVSTTPKKARKKKMRIPTSWELLTTGKELSAGDKSAIINILDSLEGDQRNEAIAYVKDVMKVETDGTAVVSKLRSLIKSKNYDISNTYDSLLGSSIFDSTFKNEVKKDDFIKKYETVTNKGTLEQAAKELDEGGQSYVLKWFNTDAQHASLIDEAVGFILLYRYQAVGDYESAIAVAEKLREMGTAAGQSVQIFSILGRFDPTMMVAYAQKELANALLIAKESRTKEWLDKNASRFKLDADDIEFIRRRTLQAADLPEGRTRDIALAEIAARIQDKIPPIRGQSWKAYQRICMLLNAKTNIRNVAGNISATGLFMMSDVFGAGVDILSQRYAKSKGISANRTTSYFGRGGLVENFKAFGEGAANSYDDWRRKINTRDVNADRYDVKGQGKSFNEHTGNKVKDSVAHTFNEIDRFTSFLLDIGDRPFYQMWFANSLNNQLKTNKVDKPTKEMLEIAMQTALDRTWQNNNAWTRSVQNVKSVMNAANLSKLGLDTDYGLGDVVIKFAKTPANLSRAIWQFSPMGLTTAIGTDAKNFVQSIKKGEYDPLLQQKMVDSISKGITGTMVYILVMTLASLGYISLTGGNDEDKDVRSFENYILGMPEYSIKIGDKYYSYEWNQPMGAFLASVADYMKSKEENPDNTFFQNLEEALKSGGDVLMRQSFIKGVKEFFDAESIVDGIVDGLFGDVSVNVPQLLSQLANVFDDKKRVIYTDDRLESTINSILVRIPGLRNTLDADVDVMGREIENSQKSILNAFFNPGNTYTDVSNEVTDEVYRLYQATGNKNVFPPKASNSVKVGDANIKFTPEEKIEFQKVTGETASELIAAAMNNKMYDNLTDEQQAKLMSDIYSYSQALAKTKVLVSQKTLAAIYGEDVVTDELYNKMTDKAKQAAVDEYFLSKKEIKISGNTDKIAEHFIEKLDANDSKKEDDKSKKFNKIIKENQ